VEEGFFDGLDLTFEPGLNVVIGGRGVGKTSIIELIRFALGVPGPSSHAISVLQSGQVTVDLDIDGFLFSVARSATDSQPRSSYQFPPPIVYSQKEIESVGLDAVGRLSLIDSFLEPDASLFAGMNALVAEISSLTISLLNTYKSLEEVSGLDQVAALKKRESQLIESQTQFSSKNTEVKSFQHEIDAVYARSTQLDAILNNLAKFASAIESRASFFKGLTSASLLQGVDTASMAPLIETIQQEISSDDLVIESLIDRAAAHKGKIDELLEDHRGESLLLEAQGRDLRLKINQYNEGAGSVSRELGSVRKNIAQVESVFAANIAKLSTLEEIFESCGKYAGDLAGKRLELFKRRTSVSSMLNNKLQPYIKILVSHLSRLDEYRLQLESGLRGSGLKYKELLPTIVQKISPLELFSLVRTNSFTEFSSILGITSDRGARIIGVLRESNLGPILTCAIDDDIQLMLMDGSGYKSIDELSIGQRCTVALSIVLENMLHPLLIDQPEDHLDNEFVAGALIKALTERANKSQTIVCTHNANIPVLGGASKVVCLESNGRKGFVKHEGPITLPNIRTVIETVMEGGKQAFSIRAKFYG